jgi:hypothetical protein
MKIKASKLTIIVAFIVIVLLLVACNKADQLVKETFVAQSSFLVSYNDGGDPCVISKGVTYTVNKHGFYAAQDSLEPCAGYSYP